MARTPGLTSYHRFSPTTSSVFLSDISNNTLMGNLERRTLGNRGAGGINACCWFDVRNRHLAQTSPPCCPGPRDGDNGRGLDDPCRSGNWQDAEGAPPLGAVIIGRAPLARRCGQCRLPGVFEPDQAAADPARPRLGLEVHQRFSDDFLIATTMGFGGATPLRRILGGECFPPHLRNPSNSPGIVPARLWSVNIENLTRICWPAPER